MIDEEDSMDGGGGNDRHLDRNERVFQQYGFQHHERK
jgi:hypothetical protein